MDEELLERLKKLKIEDIIWIILIGIILLSIYANSIEKKYLLNRDQKSKEMYRELQIFIFGVAFLIYLYYTIDGYLDIRSLKKEDSSNKIYYTYLSFLSSVLILLGGIILFYIAICDKEVEAEIAFN